MWKPTQVEALWFHGGNLHQSRHYSLYLALQLKARHEGLDTPVYKLAPVHHTSVAARTRDSVVGMCTVVTRWAADEPLRILAVRDELVSRDFDDPDAWWPEQPGVIGGRDRQAGGSWCVTDVATGVTALVLNRIERRSRDAVARGAAARRGRSRWRLAGPGRPPGDGELRAGARRHRPASRRGPGTPAS